jgi:hypothetical protein
MDLTLPSRVESSGTLKDRHWNSLVESLRNGRCVLVLGPEIAADWSESGRAANSGSTTFAGALTDWLTEELIEVSKNVPIVRSLPAIAQLYEDAEAGGFGADKLHTGFVRRFQSGSIEGQRQSKTDR